MLKLGLILLALMACLTACATKNVQEVPVARLQKIPEPYCDIKTNGDLADCLVATRKALEQSNADKEAVQKWVRGLRL